MGGSAMRVPHVVATALAHDAGPRDGVFAGTGEVDRDASLAPPVQAIVGLGVLDDVAHGFRLAAPREVGAVPHAPARALLHHPRVGDAEGIHLGAIDARRARTLAERLPQ